MQATLERITPYFDPLTQLANRRATHLRDSAKKPARATRQQQELSMVVFDVDFFKTVNDSFGHLTGDEVLKHVAALTGSREARQKDVLGRIGGGRSSSLLLPPAVAG